MKKIFIIVALCLVFASQLFAASKNPLKIFKKEILGGDAKKKMALAYDSLTKHKDILHYNEDEEAIEITLDYSMKGHPEDWDLSDEQAQRWEFVTKKKNFYKLGKEIYLKYKFKINPGLNIDPAANRFKSTTYKFDLGSITPFKKEYQTALFKVKPSKDEDGEFIMWLNGKRVLEFYGPNMILDLTGGIAFKIGLYRYWSTEMAEKDPKMIEPSTLSIKEYVISKNCEKIMDKEMCDYKSKNRVSRTKYKYKTKDRHHIPEGAKKIKRLTSKTKAQKIKFQDMKGRFLAIIKNKNDKKYVKKNRGFSKEEAASIGLTKCKEKFPNFSDLENNGCYVHYETIVNDFNS